MNNKKMLFFVGILLILHMTFIFQLSNRNATLSSKDSAKTLNVVKVITDEELSDYIKGKPVVNIGIKQKLIRKLAHFSFYLILGMILYCFIYLLKKPFIYAVIIGILFAFSDEFHQLFISGRGGRLFDVYIDSVGSTIGIFIMYGIIELILFLKRKKRLNENNDYN